MRPTITMDMTGRLTGREVTTLTPTPDDHMGVLRRRMLHLSIRILDAERTGKDLTYDRKEFDALHWAVDELESRAPTRRIA